MTGTSKYDSKYSEVQQAKRIGSQNAPPLKIKEVQRTISDITAITAKFIWSQAWWIPWLLSLSHIHLGERIIAKWQLKYIYTYFINFDGCFHSPVISLHFLERKFSYKYAEWRKHSKAAESGFKSDHALDFMLMLH